MYKVELRDCPQNSAKNPPKSDEPLLFRHFLRSDYEKQYDFIKSFTPMSLSRFEFPSPAVMLVDRFRFFEVKIFGFLSWFLASRL